jgi:hypothetical protein
MASGSNPAFANCDRGQLEYLIIRTGYHMSFLFEGNGQTVHSSTADSYKMDSHNRNILTTAKKDFFSIGYSL